MTPVGVSTGTPEFFQVTQTGVLQTYGSGGPRGDFFGALPANVAADRLLPRVPVIYGRAIFIFDAPRQPHLGQCSGTVQDASKLE
jgi:hypothetical protein